MAWALLPVKAPQGAKSRLSACLSSEERTGLAAAMRDDVARALGDCPAGTRDPSPTPRQRKL